MNSTSFFVAVPYNLLLINVHQRFQILNGLSRFQAAIRVVPLSAMVAFGGIFINGLVAKSGVAPIYLMWPSLGVRPAGVAPLAYVPMERAIQGEIYAFEMLIGFGIGATFGICTIMPPRVVAPSDLCKWDNRSIPTSLSI